ncbi:MAG: transglutaminase family protein [Acidobacteria bacterium]|jgi:transglutaminase-like putative cysteine protease|nr:transglutaminase family protein [Acidobacteriota bacterium]
MNEYLKPTEFLDFDKPEVREFAERNSDKNKTATENAVSLYYAVRDGFTYNPYTLDLRRTGLRASNLVVRKSGYCIEKAILLAASARFVGVPSRLSFYNVKNHIATERIEKILGTNVLVFHGAAELFLGGRWLKTTPAFDRRLCEKLNVAPLEFDGTSDSIFQQFDETGAVFMDYLHEYGDFADFPYELALSEMRKNYPHIFRSEKYTKVPLVYELKS